MINSYQYIDKYFPEGCESCGGPVELNQSTYTYTCAICGAFVSCHRLNSEYAEIYEPKGYLASKEINEIRSEVNKAMEKLFKTDGDHKPVISKIFKDYYVEIITNSPTPVYGVYEGNSMFEKDRVIVKNIKTKERLSLSDNEYKTISHRTKAYIWLSQRLKMDVNDCKIKRLNVNQLKEALRIINAAVTYRIPKISL